MDAATQVIPRVDVEAYREQGYVHVRGVFDRATVARMRAEADAILAGLAEVKQGIGETGTRQETTLIVWLVNKQQKILWLDESDANLG